MKLLKEWVGSKKLQLCKVYDVKEDGDSVEKIWDKVLGHKFCFVLMTSDKGNRFGGYREAEFTKLNNYKKDPKAFLFSLTHGVVGRPKDLTYCLYDYNSYGPTWGNGHDLYICNNSTTTNSSYSNFPTAYNAPEVKGVESKSILAGAYNFKIVEMEVFTVLNFLPKDR